MAKPLRPTDTHDVVTVNGKKRLVRRKGIIESVRELITASPGKKDPTGRGGRRREDDIMRKVDEAVSGATRKR